MITLKEKYKDYFKVGVAVSDRTIISHKDVILTHFNSLTCENEMKYGSVCNENGEYDFTKADKIVQFARENNIAMRGHTFVWHNQTPRYIFENADKEGLIETLRNHMITIGKRYEKDIYCWDVVNEAIEDKKDEVLRDSKWLRILGPEFMDIAFRLAREVLPEAKLYYNDYNETNPIKSQKIYETVKGMLERGVPVDGIGMQCHFNIVTPTEDELRRAIELYASLGVKIQVTEMDVSMFEFEDHRRVEKPTKEMIKMQEDVYERSFRVFREYKDVIDSVTIWGVADDYTWLDHFPARNRKNWPLLFDEDHNPKEVLYKIMDF